MPATSKARTIAGWVILGLVCFAMIASASMKLLGTMPEDVKADMAKSGLSDKLLLIGAGELVSALLLLFPRTTSAGVLLTSSYWGGAICLHMSQGDSYVVPAVLLLMTWLGAALRNPEVVGSFTRGAVGPPAG
jgi:hypothetical protein